MAPNSRTNVTFLLKLKLQNMNVAVSCCFFL